ncbi:MAG TPA: NAD(P)/FAD-dependent oxidoreductase [Rhodanobacteraceae bacterium]
MTPSVRPRITVIGAGLVGALTATLLAQRGFQVEVFEKRPDPRVHGFQGGRSINLSLVERGIRPLRAAGVAEAVLATTVTMVGRMVHAADGSTNLQRYGINDREVDHSVGRGDLNVLLLDAAERAGATLHFDAGLVAADFAAGTVTLAGRDGATQMHQAGLLLGCDGAGSALRAAMTRVADLGECVVPLGHGYKELEIPALESPSPQPSPASGRGGQAAARVPLARLRGRAGVGENLAHTSPTASPSSLTPPSPASERAGPAAARFALEPHALHIWPRGNYMCIALPNSAGNFTVTLFMPQAGATPNFATLPDAEAARAFFSDEFADALALMPTFAAVWDSHPVGQLATLYLERWNLDGRAVLLGDAAHAVVPFHGQGMNAGFEDALALADLLTAHAGDPATAFATFSAQRKPNADAIAKMSLDNYVEMRDGVTDPRYLLRRALAAELTQRVPSHFMSRYRMVSFTAIPYATCVARSQQQTALMESILGKHAKITEVDLDAAAQRARTELEPLPHQA